MGLPMTSLLRMKPVTPRSTDVTSQYGGQQVGYDQQQGYGGQQQGYGGQQQGGYGDQQQNYAAQQNYGAEVRWRLDGYGVKGMAPQRFPALQPRYGSIPYSLSNGEEQTLSRWNMVVESMAVSRVQALVKCQNDGSLTVTGCGKYPSLLRQSGGQWDYVYKGGQQQGYDQKQG